MNSRAKFYLKFFVGLVLVVLILGIYQLLITGTIEVDIAPSDGHISLNNKMLSIGKHRVRSGNYKLVFSHIGFANVSQNISIKRGGYQYRAEALIPSDPDYVTWYIDHPSDSKKAEAISSKSFDANMSSGLQALPVLKQLPYVNLDPYFKVDYGLSRKYPNDPNKTAIYIYVNSDDAKKAALNWLRQQGANPDKLEIIYP